MKLTDKQKQVLLVGGILGAACLVIIVYLGFMFVRPEVAAADKKVKDLNIKIEEASDNLNKYKAFLADTGKRAQLEEAFGRVQSKLPDVQDPIEVFDLLRDYIEGTDVTFTYLDPGDQTSRERFVEYPFTIRGTAGYHQFGQLVNLIECNPDRLMRVSNFKLTNNNRRPSVHPMEIGITTFTFRNQN